MSSPGQVAGATQQAAGQTAATAKDEAQQVKGAAASAAGDVAGTAKEQVGAVAGEAASQVRGLVDQTRSQVAQQASGAQQQVSQTLQSFVSELRDMANGSGSGSGPAAEIVQQVADRGQSLVDAVGSMSAGEIVQELRSFASRRPGVFLLGALAAGAVTGRLVRGATAASKDQGPTYASQPALETGAPTYRDTAYGATGGTAYGSGVTTTTTYTETDVVPTSPTPYPDTASLRPGGTTHVETAYEIDEVDEPLPGTTRSTGLR